MKFSFGGLVSADDIATKAIEIHPNWSILFAGDDVPGVPFVVAKSKRTLADKASPSPEEVAAVVHDAHRDRLHQEIEAQVLRPFGLTVKEFLKSGKKLLTEGVYSDLVDRIMKVKISLSFIVAGFDELNAGHLFVVDGDYSPADHTPIGFCAIGSGRDAAMTTLAFNANRRLSGTSSSLSEIIYGACEAKFMSESASDVGRSTFLVISESAREPRFISSPRIDEIRKQWDRYGAPKIPLSTIETIPSMIFAAGDLNLSLTNNSFDRIFGKSGRTDGNRFAKEYQGLVRSSSYSKRPNINPKERPNPQHPTGGSSSPTPSPE